MHIYGALAWSPWSTWMCVNTEVESYSLRIWWALFVLCEALVVCAAVCWNTVLWCVFYQTGSTIIHAEYTYSKVSRLAETNTCILDNTLIIRCKNTSSEYALGIHFGIHVAIRVFWDFHMVKERIRRGVSRGGAKEDNTLEYDRIIVFQLYSNVLLCIITG